MKLSIALIVKDEAKILDKCLTSVKEADEHTFCYMLIGGQKMI